MELANLKRELELQQEYYFFSNCDFFICFVHFFHFFVINNEDMILFPIIMTLVQKL